MRRVHFATLVVLLFVSRMVLAFPPGSSQQDLVTRAASIGVTVVGYDGDGVQIGKTRGLFVRSRVVVAEYAPIKQAFSFSVRAADGTEVQASINGVDESKSVCLLSLPDGRLAPQPTRPEERSMAGLDDLQENEGYAALPDGSVVKVKTGNPSTDEKHESEVAENSWGSPVFGPTGAIIGIVTSNRKYGDFTPLYRLGVLGYVFDNPGPPPNPNSSGPPPDSVALGRASGSGSVVGLPRSDAANQNTDGPNVIRKSSGVIQGEAIRRVQPLYPSMAKAARVSGSVAVEIVIDEQGEVLRARSLAGHPLLKEAAVAAALAWRFRPTTLAGNPVKVVGTINFNFQM